MIMFVLNKRRFTALADGLIRMEFAVDGKFEDRRSIVAYAEKSPIEFKTVNYDEESDKLVLETDKMTLTSRENDKPFFPANLEIRWKAKGLVEYWRPGTRDYQNLGGTIRALDMFSRFADLSGVHVADSQSPDVKGLEWLAWEACEEYPEYYQECGKKEFFLKTLRTNFFRGAKSHTSECISKMTNAIEDSTRYSTGILSRSGYFLLNDSESAVMDEDDFPVERNRPGCQDWYFFAYGNDYKGALKDFIKLSGKPLFPAKNILGLIFSRWPAFSEKEARKLVKDFAAKKVDLAGIVLDMEWHKEGWSHWDWDEKMYPDPESFFKWCHDNSIFVTANVHPMRIRSDDSHFKKYLAKTGLDKNVEDLEYNGKKLQKIDINNCDKQQATAFMKTCHDEIVKQGLDFWWVDGTQGSINGTVSQLVTNKLYFENSQQNGKRGMLLSRYGGIGSHRYGAFFTGDTHSEWEVLEKLCEFNIRAGHVGMAYISHDTGGFSHPQVPLIDPVRYIRWLQFGVFNPVLRMHCAPGSGSRLPWDYGKDNFNNLKKWLDLRHKLLPYIYSAAREHYESGLPLVRGLFLEQPDEENSYRFDEFYFGNSILVAPILSMNEGRNVYFPEGTWIDIVSNEKFSGGTTREVFCGLSEYPVYVKAGSIIPGQSKDVKPGAGYIDDLILDIYPGGNSSAILYEDNSQNYDYIKDDGFCKTKFFMTEDDKKISLISKIIAGKILQNKRHVQIDILLEKKPKKVLLNGENISVKKAKKTGCYIIDLGILSNKKDLDLDIIK
jgi:alpha-glucosidase (family GH31 glycosyl hydrolase)